MIEKDKRIDELVDENYVHAHVLSYFGVQFYDYSEHTLEQVCTQKGLQIEQVIKALEAPSGPEEPPMLWTNYPTDLIIEYLKHIHFIFVKHTLPYIANLVQNLPAQHPDYAPLEHDLKTVFPMFVEDFIHHLYEEEDTLFSYIRALEQILKTNTPEPALLEKVNQHTLQKFAAAHQQHDDEMKGIRAITHHYALQPTTPLHIKVIYAELQAFEKNLITHARIEDDILFPKAIALEDTVRQQYLKNQQN